ncbi:cyclic nucleotide-binding protein, partial [Mesorhizobium sp. M7A.F.Ca.CA.004.06.1.1]
ILGMRDEIVQLTEMIKRIDERLSSQQSAS